MRFWILYKFSVWLASSDTTLAGDDKPSHYCLVEMGVQVMVSRFWICLCSHPGSKGFLVTAQWGWEFWLPLDLHWYPLLGGAWVPCSCTSFCLTWHHGRASLPLDGGESPDSETTSAGRGQCALFLLGGSGSPGSLWSSGTLLRWSLITTGITTCWGWISWLLMLSRMDLVQAQLSRGGFFFFE